MMEKSFFAAQEKLESFFEHPFGEDWLKMLLFKEGSFSTYFRLGFFPLIW
jgi:hypothetical protein